MDSHRYLLAIHNGPRLFIVRVPLKGAKWRDIVKGCTPIMREQGALAKDLHEFEGVHREDEPEYFAKLDRAFAGDASVARRFDLWTWNGAGFTLARKALE